MHIRQIIDKIDDDQLFVPAFQREYVWKRGGAKDLFSSLIRKHPTGTLLTWETTKPPELKGNKKYNPQMGAVKLILDGQQRVTTLYMIITGNIPPYYTKKEIENDVRGLYVNLSSLELEYYKRSMDKNPVWVNLTDIFKGLRFRTIREKLSGELSNDRDYIDNMEDHFDIIKSIPDREFVEQTIPVKANIKDAIDIFYIVNSSGVNLTSAELALAQISGYWPDARKIFKKKLSELEDKGFVFKLDFIIYALLGCTYNMGSEMKKLHSKDNLEKIQKAWEKLDNYVLDYAVNLLKSKAFIDHTNEISSVYALIPIILFVFNKKGHKLDHEEINKSIKWFFYSQIRQRYTTQMPSKLDKDLGIVAELDNPFDELLSIIKAERPLEITSDEFVGVDIRHPLFNLMKGYFKSRDAVCLGTGIGIRKNMGKKYELEKDHIFAYSILRDHGYSLNNRRKYAMAQEIANRAILTQVENREKSDEHADVYLEKVSKKFPTALDLQSIPRDENLWKIENYENFLDARRKLLASQLNEFLESITDTQLKDVAVSIEDRIEGGENSYLEFKQHLRWDVKKQLVNKELEQTVVRTIAAFNNAEGGTLIIGVDDNGTPVGLDADYNTLKSSDKDGFELHLRNLINARYGIEYAANYIDISFPLAVEKELCVLDIKKGDKPLYTKVRTQNGEVEKFYLRSGNSSPELSKPSEVASYCKSRFK